MDEKNKHKLDYNLDHTFLKGYKFGISKFLKNLGYHKASINNLTCFLNTKNKKIDIPDDMASWLCRNGYSINKNGDIIHYSQDINNIEKGEKTEKFGEDQKEEIFNKLTVDNERPFEADIEETTGWLDRFFERLQKNNFFCDILKGNGDGGIGIWNKNTMTNIVNNEPRKLSNVHSGETGDDINPHNFSFNNGYLYYRLNADQHSFLSSKNNRNRYIDLYSRRARFKIAIKIDNELKTYFKQALKNPLFCSMFLTRAVQYAKDGGTYEYSIPDKLTDPHAFPGRPNII